MYRHASIASGIASIRQLGIENGFTVDTTEDSSAFTPTNLERYQAVVFLNTSGDVLNDKQQSMLQNYLKSGGGLAGGDADAQLVRIDYDENAEAEAHVAR